MKRSIKNPTDNLPYNLVIPFLYSIENPNKKGIKGNKAVAFDDGWAPTIGAGLAKTAGIHPEWFDGREVSKRDVDNATYEHFLHDDEVVRGAYDRRFGTEEYPNPSDTLSIGPRLYAAQNRYQRGSLGGNSKGRDKILDAMASGSSSRIVEAVRHPKDKNRILRVQKAYPIMYGNSPLAEQNRLGYMKGIIENNYRTPIIIKTK